MNPVHHRLHNRCWNFISSRMTDATAGPLPLAPSGTTTSISSSMPWARAAATFSDPATPIARFRRLKAVRDVVETVGPVDGRSYARKIRAWDPNRLADPKIAEIDLWGDPIRWPAVLLGTPRAFSPTTLRYLATALWLKREGYVTENCRIIEIGVGFGGLASMNAIVSNAHTTMVDLPQVESLGKRMMTNLGLGNFCSCSDAPLPAGDRCFISNYAFTELSAQAQDEYLEKWIRPASKGVIVSNAAMFSKSIGGRSDADLLSMLRTAGIQAKSTKSSDLFSPADILCDVTLIHWNHSPLM